MSDEAAWGFTPPPFRPEEALQRLRRELRELGLSEREGCFERRGLRIARPALAEGLLRVDTVQRPVRGSPQWQSRTLSSAAELRDYVSDLKKKLAQWSDHDD
ncbi:MAG: hypothetical protein RI988_1664 [Pseudomonadota bacterium]|jgi:hypothetical protein